MKKLFAIVIATLILHGCREKDEVKPESPYTFTYQADFNAHIYIWYYSNNTHTTKSYNGLGLETASPGTRINLNPNLIDDSIMIHFSNPVNPKEGEITGTIFYNEDTLVSGFRSDTALYLKYVL